MAYSPSAQSLSKTVRPVRNVGLTFHCEECKKPRLVHSKLKLKREESQGTQNIGLRNCLICTGPYLLSVRVLGIEIKVGKYFLCENISRTSEIELPSYSVDY